MAKENIRILIVDDEQDYCESLKMILESNGYAADICFNGKDALKLLEKSNFDIVVTDLKMPVMDGYELLKEIKRRNYDTEVIMLTAFGTIEKAVESMKAGAYTYVTKGNDPEELLLEIKKAKDMMLISRKNKRLEEMVKGNYMVQSNNQQFKEMLLMAKKAAASESNILILGESGSGKEMLASFIHENSQRSKEDMLELNCQALSESILESELFGHEKGSFTGAGQKRTGLFEASSGGTLFLDEIGGVSTNLQAKLLKAIEDRVIYRMGSSTPINVDFRLLTATNRNLKEDMDNGTFRSDLFYRISTIVIEVPPLRDRREDIPLFINYFMDKYSKEMNKKDTEITSGAKTLMEEYDYPGNIRELRNIMERCMVLSDHGEIKEEYLPEELHSNKRTRRMENTFDMDYTQSLREYRNKAEKSYIENLMDKYPDDMNKVAEILSISRRQLFNKLVEFGLK